MSTIDPEWKQATSPSPAGRRMDVRSVLIACALATIVVCTAPYLVQLNSNRIPAQGDAVAPVDVAVHKETESVPEPETGGVFASSELLRREAPLVSPSQDLPPLPPNDMPLASQLPALLERAEAGDPVASCRLAVDVIRCTTHANIGDFGGIVSNTDAGNSVSVGALSPPRLKESNAKCAGFDPRNVVDLDRLLERNKQNFSIQQRVMLALLMPDGSIMRMPREIPRGMVGSATTGPSRFVWKPLMTQVPPGARWAG